MDSTDRWFIGMIAAAICFVAWAVYSDSQAQRQWQDFTAAHHCRIADSSVWSETVWSCDGFEIRHP